MKKLITILLIVLSMSAAAQISAVLYGSASDVYSINFTKKLAAAGIDYKFCNVVDKIDNTCNNEMLSVVEKYRLRENGGSIFMPILRLNVGSREYAYCVPCYVDHSFIFLLTKNSNVNRNVNIFYPNPVNDVLYSTRYIKRMEVINMTGKVIKTFQNSDRFDLTGLTAGVYCIRYEGGSRLIVKEKQK